MSDQKSNKENLVEVKEIALQYHSLIGEIPALADINFSVKTGEFISIVGPSGCGKSTLLDIIAGLLPTSSGKVFIAGKEVVGPTPLVGYMPQSDQLFEWRTIWKNVILGLEIKGKINAERTAYAEKLLASYGLADFKKTYPSQLSGGMRQRAALIRTLAVNPELLLLDEAFSALDYQTRLAMTDVVKEIIKKEHKTAVLVTHDLSEAISMSDRIVVLTKRPARVKRIYEVHLTGDTSSALQCRKAPEFGEYFQSIWKELDVHV